jgi:tetratricopeptide (TPR) repeat protein
MRRAVAFVLAVSLAAPAVACEWDYDTLQMERQRFPGALELIVGKFLRHSDRFYEWRVKDRRAQITERKLPDEDAARVYDDLAVALDKLGRHDEAIAAIRKKATLLPKVGEYETHANLGTFLVHSGRLEEGVAELKKAIEVNPDAHFGREKYQVLLVEYVIEKRGGKGRVPLPLDPAERGFYGGPFVSWLLEREGLAGNQDVAARDAEVQEATKGVLGMMRFGDYRSPVLLEALGDLLLTHGDGERQAQRLAARAYLRAAEAVGPADAKAAYRALALSSIMMQYPDEKGGERMSAASEEDGMGLSLRNLEDQLRREVKEADEWFKNVAYDEELWVEKSADPDAKFWGKYGNQEVRVGHDRLPAGKFALKGLPWPVVVALALGAVATMGAVVGAVAWRRRRPTGYETTERQGVGQA